MKKLLLCCLLAGVAGQATANEFFAANQGFHNPRLYAGASVGSASQGDICNDPFFDGNCSNQDFAWKAFGGVRFNPMMGAELSYHQLGSADMGGQTSGGNSAKLENSLNGIAVTGVGYMPVTPQIEAFGKAGAIFWERDTSKTIAEQTENSTDDGISPVLGAGAQYQLSPNLHLRGEWEHMFNIGADSNYETDTDLYSLGVMYSTL